MSNDPATAHGSGKIYMTPVDPQQYRPKESAYWEAGNSATFRSAWIISFVKRQYGGQKFFGGVSQFVSAVCIAFQFLKRGVLAHHPDILSVAGRNAADIGRRTFKQVLVFAIVRQRAVRVDERLPVRGHFVDALEARFCRPPIFHREKPYRR